MSTSIVEGIHLKLTSDVTLEDIIASDHEGNPAIYTTWSSRKREQPYINLRMLFWPAEDQSVRRIDLDVDIFTEGESSLIAETIRDRVTTLIHTKVIQADEAGVGGVRFLLQGDGEVPEPTENNIHWNVNFTGRFGAQRIIENSLA